MIHYFGATIRDVEQELRYVEQYDNESVFSLKRDSTTDIDTMPKFAIGFSSLWFLGLVASLATASLSTALTSIGQDLHLSSSQTFWIPTAGTLASTLLQPGCALLANLIGRKMALILSGGAFVLGSSFAAAAHSFAFMLVGNCFRGIGIGGIISVTDILVTDIVPLRFRGKWLSYLSVSWAFGISLGPIIGGILANKSRWRWLFIMNIPVCVLGVAVATFAFPASKREAKPFRRLDILGLLLLVFSTAAVVVPMMQAQVTYSWSDWQTLVPFILGLLGIISFLGYEQYIAVEPVIPLSSFKDRSCLLSFVCITIHSVTLWCLLFYLPIYYESIRGYSTLKTGVAALPETMSLAFVSLAVGYLITRIGHYRWSIWIGWMITILGYGLLYLLDVNTPTATWIAINMIPGIGAGMLFSSLTFAVQAPVASQHVATAVTLQTFFRSLGSTFGIAVGSSVFRGQLKVQLSKNPIVYSMNSTAALNATDALNYISKAHEIVDVGFRTALLDAYVGSLRYIWITIAALSGLALLLSLAIPSHSLGDGSVPHGGSEEWPGELPKEKPSAY